MSYGTLQLAFDSGIATLILNRPDKRNAISYALIDNLLLTGRIFDAAEALRIGLINEIVPAENLMDRARALAGQLMENSPASLAYTKRLLSSHARADLDVQIDAAVRENAAIRGTADF